MVLKYGPTDMPEMAGIVSPVHGFFYMVYVALAYDLWRRTGWGLGKMVLIVLGGVVPLMTFFVEHKIVREARALPATGADTKAEAETDAETEAQSSI
jgi:integral membrane protein